MIDTRPFYSACQAEPKPTCNYNHMTSAPVPPNYLGLPFRILVSPFVHFDPDTRLTDILMFNSKNLGSIIVAEEPHSRAGRMVSTTSST